MKRTLRSAVVWAAVATMTQASTAQTGWESTNPAPPRQWLGIGHRRHRMGRRRERLERCGRRPDRECAGTGCAKLRAGTTRCSAGCSQ